MMKKAFLAICIYAAFFFSGCNLETQDPFERMELAKRYTKDSFFKFHEYSPIPPADRKFFLNLSYFTPKKEYVVKAKFQPVNPPQSIYIQDSQGLEQEYYRVGKLEFTLLGKPCSLSVFQNVLFINDPEKKNTLFLPFWDETNGKETYAAGRFMDLHFTEGMQEIEIDFNEAYNPYCAYTHNYTCPIPPAENRIPFRVEAGEKKFEKIIS